MSDRAVHPLLQLNPEMEQGKYLVSKPEQITQTLLDLGKRPDLVNAYFRDGQESIITTVIDVMKDRGLVIMELGPDQKMNQQLLDEARTICLCKHHDVDIRFELNGLRSARFQGQQVIAAPLPESLMRYQRREYFRAPTPLLEPLICHIDVEGNRLSLPLADISLGGLALVDRERVFNPESGEIFRECTLNFPEDETEIEIALEIRSRFMIGKDEGHRVQRIGCAFLELSADKSAFIQRYINRLQIRQRH
ncbi:MAG: flagellar brake protein [Chromatiales bacterium]|nr:flagellar brake protein [Chromatiales bacterium]